MKNNINRRTSNIHTTTIASLADTNYRAIDIGVWYYITKCMHHGYSTQVTYLHKCLSYFTGSKPANIEWSIEKLTAAGILSFTSVKYTTANGAVRTKKTCVRVSPLPDEYLEKYFLIEAVAKARTAEELGEALSVAKSQVSTAELMRWINSSRASLYKYLKLAVRNSAQNHPEVSSAKSGDEEQSSFTLDTKVFEIVRARANVLAQYEQRQANAMARVQHELYKAELERFEIQAEQQRKQGIPESTIQMFRPQFQVGNNELSSS